MSQREWNPRRRRQYREIKNNLVGHGRDEADAAEVATRTVNRARERSGESAEDAREPVSRPSRTGRTRQDLYAAARRQGMKGRSTMSRAELERAVDG